MGKVANPFDLESGRGSPRRPWGRLSLVAPRHERDNLDIEQAKLRPDIAIIRNYGESHPESWVDLRFENEPSVHIVALFSGDELHGHESALRQLVAYPDQLELRSSPWPRTRLEEIRAEVNDLARSAERGAFSQWGVGRGTVNIRLRADQEHVARILHERYGDAVDLFVGWLHFPDVAHATPAGRPGTGKTPHPTPEELPDELYVSVDGELVVKSGGNLRSTIRLHNHGQDEVVVMTNGQVTARVVDPETRQAIGGYSGAQTMPLVRFHAPAGDSVEIPLLVGTASRDPGLGYAVPPGRWAIEVTLGLEDRGSFRMPMLPITVVA